MLRSFLQFHNAVARKRSFSYFLTGITTVQHRANILYKFIAFLYEKHLLFFFFSLYRFSSPDGIANKRRLFRITPAEKYHNIKYRERAVNAYVTREKLD